MIFPALPPLTTEQFLAAVHGSAPRIAVFDYDGTLWPGDAGSGFMDWSIRTGLLAPVAAQWLQDRHRAYREGQVDEITICGEMVTVYQGLSEAEVRASALAYFRAEVEPHLYPVMVNLVLSLREAGAEIWAVSSTNNWVIEEGVRALGIVPDRVLAACIHAEGGVLTGRLRDVPSDEKKAEALKRSGVVPDVVFGNSIHDFAMLQMARQPFAVNPNSRLLPEAQRLGWPVYYPVSETYTAA